MELPVLVRLLEDLFASREPGARWGTPAGLLVRGLILNLVALTVTLLRWLLHPEQSLLPNALLFCLIALTMQGLALLLYHRRP